MPIRISLIILAYFFCTQAFTYSQDVFKMRTYQSTSIMKGGKSDTAVWKNTDALVVINYENKTIKIYSKKGQDFDLIRIKKEEQTDEYYSIRYISVDKNGTDCEITLMLNENPTTIHIGTLFIHYPEGTILMRLKRI